MVCFIHDGLYKLYIFLKERKNKKPIVYNTNTELRQHFLLIQPFELKFDSLNSKAL